MEFRIFDLLDTLFGSLLGALFLLGTFSIATVVCGPPDTGFALAGPVLTVPALAAAGQAATLA